MMAKTFLLRGLAALFFLTIVIVMSKLDASLRSRVENGIYDEHLTHKCGRGTKNMSIPKCARKFGECIKSKCNHIDERGIDEESMLQMKTKTIKPLPFTNRTIIDENHFTTEGYIDNGFRLSVCEDAKVAYMHVFKAAGTYTVLIFKKFCIEVTGKDVYLVTDELVNPEWTIWTTMRDPERRFISSMFELSRRKGERTDGGISSIITSLNDENSTNETIVGQFIDIFTENYSTYNFHLHPQIDFLIGPDHEIFQNLDYVIHLDDGDLLLRILVLLHHMFKKSYPNYNDYIDISDYSIIQNHRNKGSRTYGIEDDNFGEDFFKNIKIEHLEDEFRERVKAMYKWDYDCFRVCNY